jgi:hypothetical protein
MRISLKKLFFLLILSKKVIGLVLASALIVANLVANVIITSYYPVLYKRTKMNP